MYCIKCGSQNSSSSSFCVNCGHGLVQQVKDVGPAKTIRIRIHPRGTRVTDPVLVEFLSMRAPTAFRKAQDVLVAAQKVMSGSGGWFSSDKSRRKTLERELVNLLDALEQDRWSAISASLEDDETSTGKVVDFLCLFSDAFPNWQKEYELINDVLRR